MLPSDDLFEVSVAIDIEPSKDRAEFFGVTSVGRFRKHGKPTLPMQEFVQLQAVAILLPSARQSLSIVTGSSFLGPFFLPTIAVAGIARNFDFDKSTAANS